MARDPSSITFNAVDVGGGALGAQPSAQQLGVSGGGVSDPRPVRSGGDWFDIVGGMEGPDANLPAFINELVEPAMAVVRQRQMWDGFVAARDGATQQEISESQPWYTKMFGPTNYEIGASTYGTLDAVHRVSTDVLARMPELRKLPPEEMAREFNRISQENMSGNTYADSLFQKAFMDQAGPLMDLHTKERLAWQQAELVKGQYQANSSNSTAYNTLAQRTAALGSSRPADEKEADKLTQSQLALLDGLMPSMYQTDESYKAAVTSFVRGAADRGEFYTLKFLRQRGVYDAMDPDMALDLQTYVRGKEDSYKAEYLDKNPAIAERMALVSLYAAEGIGAEPTQAQMNELNAKYAADTGIDSPLYSGSQMASGMAQSAGAHIRAQEAVLRDRAQAAKAAGTEQAKLAAQEEDIRAGVEAFRRGTYAQTINIPGVDKEMIEANVVQEWNSTFRANPQTALGQLVWNANTGRGSVLKGVADQYQTRARAVLQEQPNDAARDLYNEWRALKNTSAQRLDIDGQPVQGRLTGATTAALYFGDAVNTMFNRMQALEESNVDFQLAYEIARGEITTDDPTTFDANSRKESEAIQARVQDVLQSATPKYFSYFGNRLGKSGREAAARAIVRAVGESGGLLDTSSEGLTAALTHARLKYGGEDAGKYYWENGRDDEGHVIQSVGAWLGFMDTKETGPAIEDAIDAELRAHDIEPSADLKTDIFRMRDSETGEPTLYINTVGPRGWRVIPVRGTQIKQAYEKRAESSRRRSAPVPQGFVRMPDGSIQQSISIQPKL